MPATAQAPAERRHPPQPLPIPAAARAPALDRSRVLRAIELQHAGRIADAEALLREHLALDGNDAAALYSLGVILLQREDHDAALALLAHGVEVAPGLAMLWGLHGAVLLAAGRQDEALASWNRALELKPDYAEILLNSGALLRKMHRHAEALMRFHQLLALQPEHKGALGNAAILLTEFKKSREAIALFERLLQIDPGYDYGLGLLLYERLHICDWSGFDAVAAQVIDGLHAGRRTCKSLPLMAITDDPRAHQQSARLFAAHHFPPARQRLWNGEVYRHDRIRLAYLSADLREHPVGHLVAGIVERHDKARFETIAVSFGVDDGSRLRARFQSAFDQFVDVRGWGTRQIAQWMREREIDIAVDLGGYTSDARSDVLAMKPAPAQVNWLGYPGTMGVPTMDYLIADRHVIPPAHRAFYDEQVVYLPHAYLPPASGVQIAERTPTRAECGLPESGLVFCCFNHDYKIAPAVFAIWLRLLQTQPGSVLWLMSRNELSKQNLRAAAAAQGVDPARLVFAGRVPRVEDHLARYRVADLFLDTHPYNAHTTAADALLAGLPVLTAMGRGFPSRVAGSLLHAAGLPEFITGSLADYEAKALNLAGDPAALAAAKARLAAQRAASPLFDSAGFTRDLEAAYIAMWRRSQLGDHTDALLPA
jgi:protein O-GlcNAc transferase